MSRRATADAEPREVSCGSWSTPIRELVGLYEKNGGFGLCDPRTIHGFHATFSSRRGCDAGAVTGHKVIVKIRDYGNGPDKKPEGVITSILGHMNDPGVDILSIVESIRSAGRISAGGHGAT